MTDRRYRSYASARGCTQRSDARRPILMTHSPRGHASLGHAPLTHPPRNGSRCRCRSANQWTLEELQRLPDDGNKYEWQRAVRDARTGQAHEIVLARRTRLLEPYVSRHGLGRYFILEPSFGLWTPRRSRTSMVRAEQGRPSDQVGGRADVRCLIVEVMSPTTRRRDHVQ